MITYKGRQIPQTPEEIVAPAHTALIVHEMINDTVSKGGDLDKLGRRIDASGILRPMKELVDQARRSGVGIVYVRFTRHPDYSTYSDPMIVASYEQIMDPAKRTSPLVGIQGTWGWEIKEEVKPEKGDIVVSKYRVDSFIGTNLDLILRSNGVRTIVIVGVGSEAGIVPTVLHAFNLGLFVVAVEDCILPADPTWRDVAMKFIARSAIVKPSGYLINVWRAGTE